MAKKGRVDKPWTPKQTAKRIELKRLGVHGREIARQTGKSIAACHCKWQVVSNGSKFGELAEEPTPGEAKPAPGQSVAEELRLMKPPVATATATVRCHWQDDPEQSAEDMWAKAEVANERHIERSKLRGKFSVSFSANEPIAVAFASDQHIAINEPVDLARMRADAEYIRDTPNLFVCLAGDGVDNHIKHHAALISSKSKPSEQYLLYEYYLQMMGEKILAMCSGNHDAWTVAMAGIDMVKFLADKNKIAYAPAEARLYVDVGGYEYKIAVRHQYRMNSSFNQTHSVKQWQRLGAEEFDIGAIGHHHEADTEAFDYRNKRCWACRPGSYQVMSAHSHQYGYNSTYATCPTFILYPGERKITGFDDMRDAGVFLKALLGR